MGLLRDPLRENVVQNFPWGNGDRINDIRSPFCKIVVEVDLNC